MNCILKLQLCPYVLESFPGRLVDVQSFIFYVNADEHDDTSDVTCWVQDYEVELAELVDAE